MEKRIYFYEELFNNMSEPILLMEDNHFIDGNITALNLFNISTKNDIYLLHPSQLSPKYQPDGELSSVKSDMMIKFCLESGEHIFDWLSKTIDNKTFHTEVTLKRINLDNKQIIQCHIKSLDSKKVLEKKIFDYEHLIAQKDIHIKNITHILSNDSNKTKDLIESIQLLEEYKKALDESSIVSKANIHGIITYVNDKFCEISGYTREELLGNRHSIVKNSDTKKEFYKDLWTTLTNKEIFKGILKNRKKNGEAYYVNSMIIPILDKNNDISEYIAIRNDITSLYEKDKMIHEQFTDELTLLPNRQKLLCDIKNFINPKLALINIDRFRDINNSYGIEIGDKILKAFTKKLMVFKSINLDVYRISGDVFAFIASGNIKIDELYKICANLNKMCHKEDFIIDDNSFDIAFTIGIAESNTKLLSHAEVALSWAKQTNVDVIIFDKNLPIYKDLKRNINLTKEIKQALKNDNILMYGQKIINNKTKEVKYETLMRMKDSNGNIISPFIFLECAKKARLYPQMTNKIIEKACDYFKDKDTKFSINLMIEDIKNEKTIDFLFSKLIETKTANKVILEIVESEGIEKFEEVGDFIKKAKAIGCKVAIDDFGTGYSNFEYIINLNIDYLKIDGSLIKNIHINENVKLTVSTIVNFAKVLGIQTVAEFVHCQEVQNVVESLGIDFSQGYLLHKPDFLER